MALTVGAEHILQKSQESKYLGFFFDYIKTKAFSPLDKRYRTLRQFWSDR